MLINIEGVYFFIFICFTGFFYGSISSGPLSIQFGPFKNFTKIRRDIRKWRLITNVNNTGNKCENIWDKVFPYLDDMLLGFMIFT